MDISSCSYDKLPEKYMLGFYYPAYFEYDSDGSKYPQNPEFNGYSEMIIDMKDGYGYAINNFHDNLSRTLLDVKNIVIVTPPTNSVGIEYLAEELSTSNKEITYLTGYFGRFGKREIYSNNKYSIADRKIILLDDVVTRGETMEKCRQLLDNAGAKKVKCITLGRTCRNIEEAYYKLEEVYDLKRIEYNKKYSLELIDILQKSADELRSLSYCSNESQTIVHEIRNKISDDLESLDELHNYLWCDLCNYEEEARNVINGDDTFHSSNILQEVFLW